MDMDGWATYLSLQLAVATSMYMSTCRQLKVCVLNPTVGKQSPSKVNWERRAGAYRRQDIYPETLIFRDLMLGEMKPRVAARDWALSPAPLCPGLSFTGLQHRAEDPQHLSAFSGMQLARTILSCWRKGVKIDKRESGQEEAQAPAASRAHEPHLQGLQPLPCPAYPWTGGPHALLQGQHNVRKCIATKIPKYKQET